MAKQYETDHDYFSGPWAKSEGEILVLQVQTMGTKQIKDEIRVLLHSVDDVAALEAAVKAARRSIESHSEAH